MSKTNKVTITSGISDTKLLWWLILSIQWVSGFTGRKLTAAFFIIRAASTIASTPRTT